MPPVGLDRLGMLHLNDSKTPSAPTATATRTSARARSALEGLPAPIVYQPGASPVLPGILEVPGFDGAGPDALNVQRLRDLVNRLRVTGSVPTGRVVSAARTTNVVVASRWAVPQ